MKQSKQFLIFCRPLIWALILLLFAAGLCGCLRQNEIVPEPTITPQLTPVTPAPTPEPTPLARVISEVPISFLRTYPVKIMFPGYGVESELLPMGVDYENAIDTPDDALVAGWFCYFSAPDEEGNCIMNGHDRWKGVDGHFAVLKKMAVGDEVQVLLEDGRLVRYEVEVLEEYRVDDHPEELVARGGETRLTLITCKGDYDVLLGTSRTRVVAVCRRTGIDEAANG
ncbi:class F sortase [Eubacteriales bacterium OttesenSCG-928-K08]|nr:class F sortase [Eubacteriales bacterium OttesenSCG-928-K08]